MLTENVIITGNPMAAVYAEHPAPNVSERYEFFPTHKVVDYMENNGFEISRMIGLNKRAKYPEQGQHLVTFRKKGQQEVVGGYPELIFWNSHNRSRAARFLEGFYRSVCANGCVFGQFQNDTGRIQHSYNNPFQKLMDIIQIGVESIDRKILHIVSMKNRHLDYAEEQRFEYEASKLRTGIQDPHDVGVVQRYEDRSNDLWTVYNRAQEALLRGNFESYNPTNGKYRKARPLTNIKKMVDTNTKLWELTQTYME